MVGKETKTEKVVLNYLVLYGMHIYGFICLCMCVYIKMHAHTQVHTSLCVVYVFLKLGTSIFLQDHQKNGLEPVFADSDSLECFNETNPLYSVQTIAG